MTRAYAEAAETALAVPAHHDDQPVLLLASSNRALLDEAGVAFARWPIQIAADSERLIELAGSTNAGVVIIDSGFLVAATDGGAGPGIIAALLRPHPALKIILLCPPDARGVARDAIAAGAWDVYHPPIDAAALGLIVARAFRVHELEVEASRSVDSDAPVSVGGLITAAPEMTQVLRTVGRVARADVSVLLSGASGTGKELLALHLHAASPRARGAFVAINCAAIPDTLLESELFGHEKGAFTGAIRTTPGKIEQAAGGTLFLDEIGDVPLALQVKLLRFLQEHAIERIGGRRQIVVDTRIVCATHRDIDQMVAHGQFREDLYYRLAQVVVPIPPLSQRPGDAVLLARHFVAQFAPSMNPVVRGLAADAIAAIDAHTWPGNVRELENRVKRAVIMADARLIIATDLDLTNGDDRPVSLRAAREAADRRAIHRALARTDGNISQTARLLGVSRPTLYDLLKSYDLHA
ncbi:PEP-CTERM-box response regulator transcription factor [Sphingomonas sp.]|uniref:PEP-CTERM-box response regulator transcription factor n=1 Tax=Sphingomonas sp. TaxID=28214 RepID=UPI0026240431|nr:PEP-CTERM-box response regulator transcription factor [Sphingomonas sp.]MDF2493506.1 PEP-CTERM-box response regulator transcription factor [Sphingomonas sp.]